MPDDATPVSWLELLVRMCAGEASEKPFVGVLEIGDAQQDDEWPAPVRVFKDRARYRVESLDGQLLTIRVPEHTWEFRPDDEVPTRIDQEGGYESVALGAHGHTIQRRRGNDWDGDDFTTPTGPARAVTYLGRDAWEVELAPPEHKPSALVLTIDATTGMVYQSRSVQYGVLSRWTEIAEVDSHPESLFEWDGDAIWYEASYREVSDEEIEQEEAERAAWMSKIGLPSIVVAENVPLFPHESDDETGGFYASFRLDGHGVVIRRPRSDEEWELDFSYDHVERWSDDEWDWCVASGSSAGQAAEIRRQLAEPSPKDA